MAVPVAATVWASTWLFGRTLPSTALLLAMGNTFVISGAFIAAFVAPAMDKVLLPDGREVPVSRAYARDLRGAGWF